MLRRPFGVPYKALSINNIAIFRVDKNITLRTAKSLMFRCLYGAPRVPGGVPARNWRRRTRCGLRLGGGSEVVGMVYGEIKTSPGFCRSY